MMHCMYHYLIHFYKPVRVIVFKVMTIIKIYIPYTDQDYHQCNQQHTLYYSIVPHHL